MTDTPSDTPWFGRRLHFVGIGGAGMSGLALIAKQLGAEVSGCDRAESPYTRMLREAGIEPEIGHSADHVTNGVELVVSTAVPPDNPDVAAARERGAPVLHRGELLAEAASQRLLIAVSGTHGKTTTAAMIAHVLSECGLDPSFLIDFGEERDRRGVRPQHARARVAPQSIPIKRWRRRVVRENIPRRVA